ncbi:hypothetical protein FZC35_01990 [Candidatus Cytomitobacter indipagum]|uniref:Uncharacterized protein n=1 Tax=Candidatus Cytomitobacter indipagum TaxID=2601575 RepID=A0A5C0UDL4_9PROT|nr:hypothetical protein [Candidatus Cytomitobacter indipagum]QEK38135.1 hypothetical protein FZC35_01990 [Candidatus Cytomitobacter indipagum]
MNKKLLLLCISKIFCVFEVEESHFGIMDVGQGNCNIMIYDLIDRDRKDDSGEAFSLSQKVGYMYDCGSSEYPARLNKTHNGFKANDQEYPDLCENVHEKLKELDYLTIFLSHPDMDHFNILHHILYPKNSTSAAVVTKSKYYSATDDRKFKGDIKIAVFAFGDWSKETGIEGSFKKSLSQTRPGSIRVPSVDPTSIERAEDLINTGDIPVAEPYFWQNAAGESPQFFSGNLTELFDLAKNANSLKNFTRGCDSGYLGLFDEVNSVLAGYVNIVSANTRYADIDEQNVVSPLISFTHKISPDQDQYVSVLCTGDADNNAIAQMLINKEFHKESCEEFVKNVEDIIKEYKPQQRDLGKQSKIGEAKSKGIAMMSEIGTLNVHFEDELQGKIRSSILHQIVGNNFNSVMNSEMQFNKDNHHIVIIAPHHGADSSLCSAISLFKPALIISSNGHGERVQAPSAYVVGKVTNNLDKYPTDKYSKKIIERLAELNKMTNDRSTSDGSTSDGSTSDGSTSDGSTNGRFNFSTNQLTSYGRDGGNSSCSYWISTNNLKNHIERSFAWKVEDVSSEVSKRDDSASQSEQSQRQELNSQPAQEGLVDLFAGGMNIGSEATQQSQMQQQS